MKIKAIGVLSGHPDGVIMPDSVCEYPDDEAKRLISLGVAVEVEAPSAISKLKPQKEAGK